MSDIVIGPTANRRVLGCLNEAAFAVSDEFGWMHERWLGDHELFRAARPGSRLGLAQIH